MRLNKMITQAVIIIAVAMYGLWLLSDSVVYSLPRYDDYESYSTGFQDYTIYRKFYYHKNSGIAKGIQLHPSFKKISERDINKLNEYFDDFEAWLEYADFKDKYDFKRNCIDISDYACMTGDEYSFDVYFFDMQTYTLYYIHNNV